MASSESTSVYMTLESRAIPGTFHWGLFVSSSFPKGQYYHATNKFGGWQLEIVSKSDVMTSMALVLVYKLSDVSSQNELDQVLRAVPADGSPSLRTGEAFNCRIWMKDALVQLHDGGIITLGADIDTIVKILFDTATPLEGQIERGEAKASVLENLPEHPSSRG